MVQREKEKERDKTKEGLERNPAELHLSGALQPRSTGLS